jgi:hypothetical protein
LRLQKPRRALSGQLLQHQQPAQQIVPSRDHSNRQTDRTVMQFLTSTCHPTRSSSCKTCRTILVRMLCPVFLDNIRDSRKSVWFLEERVLLSWNTRRTRVLSAQRRTRQECSLENRPSRLHTSVNKRLINHYIVRRKVAKLSCGKSNGLPAEALYQPIQRERNHDALSKMNLA